MTGVEALVWCVAIVCATILSLAILATLAGGKKRPPVPTEGIFDPLKTVANNSLRQQEILHRAARSEVGRGVDSLPVPPAKVSTDERTGVEMFSDFPDEPVSPAACCGGYRPHDGQRRTLDDMSADNLADD